jgi:hypothetical protein
MNEPDALAVIQAESLERKSMLQRFPMYAYIPVTDLSRAKGNILALIEELDP